MKTLLEAKVKEGKKDEYNEKISEELCLGNMKGTDEFEIPMKLN